jgi:type I restriction enzyme M protein
MLDFMREQADEYFSDDPAKHFNYRHSFAENKLFGIEISEAIARVAKMNMILHDDGHTNVISHDGLDDIEKMRKHNL